MKTIKDIKKDGWKSAYIGKWFIKKKDARKYAKQKGGRRIIYETDNGFLVI